MLLKQVLWLSLILFLGSNSYGAFPIASSQLVSGSRQQTLEAANNGADEPSKIVNTFSKVIGRNLHDEELDQLSELMEQVNDLQSQPQLVATLGGVEITPLICGQIKASVKIPVIKSLGAEITPCFDPLSKKSYIMTGLSGSSSQVAFAGSIMAGMHIASARLQRDIEGQYYFANISKAVLPFIDGSGQVSIDAECVGQIPGLVKKDMLQTQAVKQIGADIFNQLKQCQYMVFGGVSFDVGQIAKMLKSKIFDKSSDSKTLSAGGVSVTAGTLFVLKEFPWYTRLQQGMNLLDAFDGAKEPLKLKN